MKEGLRDASLDSWSRKSSLIRGCFRGKWNKVMSNRMFARRTFQAEVIAKKRHWDRCMLGCWRHSKEELLWLVLKEPEERWYEMFCFVPHAQLWIYIWGKVTWDQAKFCMNLCDSSVKGENHLWKMSLDQKPGNNRVNLLIVPQIKSHFCESLCDLLFQNGILHSPVQCPEACINCWIYGVPIPITGWPSTEFVTKSVKLGINGSESLTKMRVTIHIQLKCA